LILPVSRRTHRPSPGGSISTLPNRAEARKGAGLPLICVGLGLAALATAVASLAIGPAHLSLAEVLSTLSGHGDAVAQAIVLDIRVPRAILALLIGAVLGLAGAALQGLLRNPLAEPSVLGASNGAALGAVIVIYFGLARISPALLPIAGVTGALAALGLLLLLARQAESALGLVLAGIAVSTLAGAAISLALNLAANPYAVMEITFWLMGSLEDRSFQHVLIALVPILAGAVLLAWDGRALDALALGEDGARALGVNVAGVRRRLVLGVGIGVGGAVAVSGAIGFIGLVAPHLARPLTDGRPSQALLPSALIGALLLAAADILVRITPGETELRLGVVTAFLGVPFFLALLIKSRRVW
jgi:iron complex transport system permease protein